MALYIGYEPVGQEFESLRAHHKKIKRLAVKSWPLFSCLLLVCATCVGSTPKTGASPFDGQFFPSIVKIAAHKAVLSPASCVDG